MTVIVNKNTTQSPLTATGRTGTQSIKMIPAPRVYIGPPDLSTTPAVYFGASNGTTPTGFTDLGIVEGNAAVTLSRTTSDIYAGVDRFCVGQYSQSTSGRIEFSLSQFDDAALESVSGMSPHAYVNGSYARYLVGGQPLFQTGLMLVVQNKIDGKEWQFYNPAALLLLSYDSQGDALKLKVSAILPGFKGYNPVATSLLSLTIIANGAGATGYGITAYGLSFGG